MKKSLIIILIAVITIGTGVGLYFYFKNKKEQTPEAIPEGKVAEYVMQTAVISPNNEWVYFYSSQNIPAFYRYNLKNKATEQISEQFQDIQEIRFSSDLNYAIFQVYYESDRFEKYGSPFSTPKMNDGDYRFWTYSFKDKKLSYLDNNISNAVFSADNKKLIYTYQHSNGKIKINQSNIDGSSYQEIADWGFYEANIYPIDNNIVYLSFTSDTDEASGGLYSLKIKEKELKLLDNKKYSPILSISPSKKKILFIKSEAVGSKIQTVVWTNDINLKNYKNITTEKNLEFDYNNIVWSKDENNVYIAAKPAGNEIFNSIYQIDLGGGEPKLFLKDEQASFQAVNINAEGNILYYLLNSQLYAAKI